MQVNYLSQYSLCVAGYRISLHSSFFYFLPVDISAVLSSSGPNRTGLQQHSSPTWSRTPRLSTLLGPGCCSPRLSFHLQNYPTARSWTPGTTWSGGRSGHYYFCSKSKAPWIIVKKKKVNVSYQLKGRNRGNLLSHPLRDGWHRCTPEWQHKAQDSQ